MKRAKKPKKPLSDRPTKTPLMYVTQTNYVNLAIMVRTLHMVYGWTKEELLEPQDGSNAVCKGHGKANGDRR